jgi:hypothetical protein
MGEEAVLEIWDPGNSGDAEIETKKLSHLKYDIYPVSSKQLTHTPVGAGDKTGEQRSEAPGSVKERATDHLNASESRKWSYIFFIDVGSKEHNGRKSSALISGQQPSEIYQIVITAGPVFSADHRKGNTGHDLTPDSDRNHLT